jgi:cysteine desulfurase/selenocysteine lyase
MKKNVYMDAAASWLKPELVIRGQVDFLSNSYANAGRGICERAGAVDKMVMDSRQLVADFIGGNPENIVWTSGATDGLNRIVNILTEQPWYKKTSSFAVSDLDHHSARLPWENLLRCGRIRENFICDLDENLNIDVNSIPKTDFLIITAMSNVLGAAQDVENIIRVARAKNPDVVTIVDASQYIVHKKIDVKKWDCDFLVFSGHKIGADTGVGVLYIRDADKYFPDKFGGGMINKIIDDSHWIFNSVPEKFEAGTLPLTQIAGLPYAIKELSNWCGSENLIKYMYDELSRIPHIKLLTKPDACMLDFVVDNMHCLDVGAVLGTHNICVRVGNMCASWIHKKLGIDGSVRVSVGPWNTKTDVEYFIETIRKMVK